MPSRPQALQTAGCGSAPLLLLRPAKTSAGISIDGELDRVVRDACGSHAIGY